MGVSLHKNCEEGKGENDWAFLHLRPQTLCGARGGRNLGKRVTDYMKSEICCHERSLLLYFSRLQQMGIQRDSRLVMHGRILSGSAQSIDCTPIATEEENVLPLGKYRDMPVISGGAPVNTTERAIQQQIKAYDRSLREGRQKGAPSFSVPNSLPMKV